MALPHPTAKEEASTPLVGHIFSRFDVIPASGEVSYSIANDKRDGFGRPGRTGYIVNGSIANNLFFQISSDGEQFSNEITLPSFGAGFPNFVQVLYDDGILIHTVRFRGTIGQPYGLIVAPGREPEGFIPQFAPSLGEAGPLRKMGRGKVK